MARLTQPFALFILCLFGWGATGSTGHAQTEERLVAMDLTFFSPFRPHPPPLYYRAGEDYKRIVFPRNMQGDTQHYEGPETITFFTKRAEDAEEEVYVPAAQAHLGEGLRHPLLVFTVFETEDQQTAINVLPMENDLGSFPAGNLSVINLTGITMQAMIGDRRVKVRSGVGGPYAFADSGVFRLGLAFEFEGRAYPSFLNTVTLDPTTRHWMFIGSPRRAGSARVRVRFMEDHTLLRQRTGGG